MNTARSSLRTVQRFDSSRPSSSHPMPEFVADPDGRGHSPDCLDFIKTQVTQNSLFLCGRSEIGTVSLPAAKRTRQTLQMVIHKIGLGGQRIDVGNEQCSSAAKGPLDLLVRPQNFGTVEIAKDLDANDAVEVVGWKREFAGISFDELD